MTITELIKELEIIKELHGDCNVYRHVIEWPHYIITRPLTAEDLELEFTYPTPGLIISSYE